jgi:cytochrome c oxidase assembly protein subunit 15
MNKNNFKYTKTIRIWLILGLVMLVGQVILGGITRLTGSGLSITKWEVITGVIPPLNHSSWVHEFELYKQTPQFHKLNASFTLHDFKFIYFWEYFHRLWVRALGFIFLIPFLIFIVKKQINLYLIKRLAVVILLTILTASAGWIMVLSGFINRPWVNAYKLTLHFILAILVISAMIKTIADVYNYGMKVKLKEHKFVVIVVGIAFVQMIFAGLMSGMKAGLYYPSWPDMNGEFIPEVLKNANNWNFANLGNYDSFLFAPALIQFMHRFLAYLLAILTCFMFYKLRNLINVNQKKWILFPIFLVLVQVILGILTVLNVQGKIPLILGVTHQLVGLLYFMSLLFLLFNTRVLKA